VSCEGRINALENHVGAFNQREGVQVKQAELSAMPLQNQ